MLLLLLLNVLFDAFGEVKHKVPLNTDTKVSSYIERHSFFWYKTFLYHNIILKASVSSDFEDEKDVVKTEVKQERFPSI